MSLFSLLAIAVALALDAFAVATVAGISLETTTRRHLFRLSFHFGFFQSLMLAAGFYLGIALRGLVAAFDHWIAFGLLAFVGGNLIRNAFLAGEAERKSVDPTRGWELVFLSVATSVDALAVGISLAVVRTPIAFAALVVGLTAAMLTVAGMLFGRRVGELWGRGCEIAGGVVLIAIGSRILWVHLTQ